jgi:hypothetical protein
MLPLTDEVNFNYLVKYLLCYLPPSPTLAFIINQRFFLPVILATQEAEIRRVEVQSQPRQVVL